jgi:DNA topoisomerase IA
MKYLIIVLLIISPFLAFSQKIGDGVQNIYNSVGLITYLRSAGKIIEEALEDYYINNSKTVASRFS